MTLKAPLLLAGVNGKTDMGNSGGRFVWYELATTDMDAAKAFYASVVGWGTAGASMPDSVYTLFTAGNTPVAGLMKMPPGAGGTVPQWLGYVAVDDVDVVAGKVEIPRWNSARPANGCPECKPLLGHRRPAKGTACIDQGPGGRPSAVRARRTGACRLA